MADKQIYCDGVMNISLVGGMVRLDLFTLSPTEKDKKGAPAPTLSRQIVMPPDGFMQAFNGMSRLIQQLKDKGMVREIKPAAKDDKEKPAK
jgi:hypothetical protein